MSELRKTNTTAPYFITLTVVGWLDIFTRQRYCDILIQSLQYCIRHKSLEVYSYVIMPSHVHLIARSPMGGLNAVLRDFKRHTAKAIIHSISTESGESRRAWVVHMLQYHAKCYNQNERFAFWQKTNFPIELESDLIFNQKEEYIMNNPVQAGYVTQPEFWYYSSASPDSPLKVHQA
jgi:REP element-mobilizing transposase RayT